MQFEEKKWFEGKPGTKESFAIRMGEMPNGLPYLLPVMVLSGSEDGPTFFVNAAMHGDEILGTESVRQAWKRINVAEMKGRAVMIPMANVAGVGTRTRRNVLEMYPGPHDMNRVFPGNPKGIMTERIANLIAERFIGPADFVFDIHCASVGGEWLPYVHVPTEADGVSARVIAESTRLGRAWGAPMIYPGNIQGSLVGEAYKQGKIAGSVEFGVANFSTRPERIWGRTGVINLFQEMGMLPGEPEYELEQEQFTVKSMSKIITDRGGFLHERAKAGDRVSEGDTLALMMSLDGEEIATFEAPHDGVVARRNTMGVVGTGDIIAYVAEVV